MLLPRPVCPPASRRTRPCLLLCFGRPGLAAGSGAKRASIIASVTLWGADGFQRGALSLSTITARVPSAKSWSREMRAATAYSWRISSAKLGMSRPFRQQPERDLAGLGGFGTQDGELLRAHSPSSAWSAARISSSVSEANRRSIGPACGTIAANGAAAPRSSRNLCDRVRVLGRCAPWLPPAGSLPDNGSRDSGPCTRRHRAAPR